MPHIRLIGLLLFITGVVLGLAAAATRTTHVSVRDFWLDNTSRDLSQEDSPVTDPLAVNAPVALPAVSFTSIPVSWPLIGLSGIGLCLWFMQSPPPVQRGKSRRSRRRVNVQRKH